MSSGSTISARGRYKIFALAGAIFLLLVGLAYMRTVRLADTLGRGDTFHRVRSVLVRRMGVPEAAVKPEATLDSLQSEGLNRSELAAALQEEFEADVSEDETNRLTTVQDAVRLVETKGLGKRR